MKFASYDIVFQEIPDEVTLALNISGCPCHCAGCHSPHLWEDFGEELTEDTLGSLLYQYGDAITCVCFMGGDADTQTINKMCSWVHSHRYKTAWYSGRQQLSSNVQLSNLDYLKLGPYIESLGSLKSTTTNQKLYRILSREQIEDITSRFWNNAL